MFQALKDIWVKNWAHWLGGLQTSVGTGLIMLHTLSTDSEIRTLLTSIGATPKHMLILAVVGIVTMIASPHKDS